MKRLTIVRHAKSSWEYQVADYDRPLKERGVNDAILVANELGSISVDAVFSSFANRALHTCLIFLRILKIDKSKLTVVDDLYDFSGGDVMAFVKSLDDGLENVMIFGHNHAFTSISNIFGSTYIDNLPTSGLVTVEFDSDHWSDIDKGTTKQTIFPRDLK